MAFDFTPEVMEKDMLNGNREYPVDLPYIINWKAELSWLIL